MMAEADKTYHMPPGHEVVQGKTAGRHPIFFDMNGWIDLVDSTSPEVGSVRERLRSRMREGLIFCPPSAEVLWELQKQALDSQIRVAEMIDELSLGVSFAIKKEIFEQELWEFVNRQFQPRCLAARHFAFVPLMYYLCSSPRLVFPTGVPNEMVQRVGQYVSEKLPETSLATLIRARGEGLRSMFASLPPTCYQQSAVERRKLTQGNKAKAWQLEAVAIFRQILHPFLQGLPAEVKIPLLGHLQEMPAEQDGSRLRAMLDQLPAIGGEVIVRVAAGEDVTRKDRPQDMFDREMIAVPLAYAAVFFSRDRWIRDLLRNRCDILRRRACRFVDSWPALGAWLGDLQQR